LTRTSTHSPMPSSTIKKDLRIRNIKGKKGKEKKKQIYLEVKVKIPKRSLFGARQVG